MKRFVIEKELFYNLDTTGPMMVSKLGPSGIPDNIKPEEWLSYLQEVEFKFYTILSVEEIDETGSLWGKPIPLKWRVVYM